MEWTEECRFVYIDRTDVSYNNNIMFAIKIYNNDFIQAAFIQLAAYNMVYILNASEIFIYNILCKDVYRCLVRAIIYVYDGLPNKFQVGKHLP